MNTKMISAAALLVCLVAPLQAQSAPILEGAVTSPQGSFGDCYSIENAGNQSGLSASYVSGLTDFASFVSTTTHSSPMSGCNSGFTNGDTSPQQFTIDMGRFVSVNALAFWATNSSGSVTRFDFFSDTDGNFANGGLTLLGSFTAAGPTGDMNTAQIFNFSNSLSRYFQLNALSSFGGLDLTSGVGELALRQAVPEPNTMALLGLSMVALLGVRGRKAESRNADRSAQG